MRVYVENGKPKLFVFDDSPYDWNRELGKLVDTPFTSETHSIGDLAYDEVAGTVKEAPK